MKSSKLLIAVGAAALAGYAFVTIKKQKRAITDAEIKAKQDAEAAAKAIAQAKADAKSRVNSLLNKNSYASKVAKVQLFLGVTPDGIVGKNTLLALKEKMPKYTKITSTNIDAILYDINSYKPMFTTPEKKADNTSTFLNPIKKFI